MSGALRIATRASELALRRARVIQAMLAAQGHASELVTFKTSGDKRFEEWLSGGAANSRAAFVREIETALVKGKADLAVHALSDMSTDEAPELVVAALLPRDDPRDALVLNRLLEATSLADVPRGTRIGSSSVRCRALLRALFPDIEVVHLRGDLPTRIHKVDEGQVHGTVVSASALQRLAISQRVGAFFAAPEWLPAPGQGIVAIQVRAGDSATRALVSTMGDAHSRIDAAAERAFLTALEGGLQSPVGALVSREGGRSVLRGLIVEMQGRRVLRAELELDEQQPELVGVRVANELRTLGASGILDEVRGADRIPAPQPDP